MAKPSKSTWETYSFDEMAVEVNNRVEDPRTSGFDRYVGLTHLDTGSLKIWRWGSTQDVEKTKMLFKSGDIIFGRRNAYLRRVSVADFDGVCSAHAMVLRARPEVALPEFLPFFMQTETFWQAALRNSAGSLSPTINWSNIAKEKFTLPPLEEQRRIAKVLQAMQQALDAHQKSQHRLLELRDAIGINLWDLKQEETPLAPLVQVSLKIQDGTHFSPQSDQGEFRYITSKNIRDGYLDISTAGWISRDEHENIYKRCDVGPGDLLLTKDGANAGNIAVNTLEKPFSLLSSVAFIRTDPERLHSTYAFEYLRSRVGRARLLAHVKGSAITRLTLTQIREFTIPVPDLEIQKRQAAHLSEIQSCLGRLQARQSSLTNVALNFRQSMEES